MPSFFKKLFGRKSKNSSDPSANPSGVLTPKKDKSRNKKSLKKQKKKDKLAHFPSKEQPLATSSKNIASSINNVSSSGSGSNHNVEKKSLLENNQGGGNWSGLGDEENEKENSPILGMDISHVNNTCEESAQSAAYDGSGNNLKTQYAPQASASHSLYIKPNLSLIAEETNGVGGDNVTNQMGMSNVGSNKNALLSPSMSANKPPLTPNRLGNRGGGVATGKPLTPSNHRLNIGSMGNSGSHQEGKVFVNIDTSLADSPCLDHSASPISPDNGSLRGVDMTRSGASDDMCLSSDNDDEEYNRIAHKENKAPQPPTSSKRGGKKEEKFVSALDRSPFSYASDDDNVLFPALVDDKDPFASQDPMDPSLALSNPRLPSKPMSMVTTATMTNTNVSQGATINRDITTAPEILPMAHETQEDIRAWTPSPTKKSSFTFSGSDKILSPSAINSSRGPASGFDSKSSKNNVDLFDNNFTDFEPFDVVAAQRKFNSKSSSKSVAGNVTCSPVSALLDDSREKRRTSRHGHFDSSASHNGHTHRSGGSSSINSAPVITPSYIRQQVQRSKHKEATSSISRVIDNLELHVNKGQSNSHGKSLRDRDMTSEASSQRSGRSAENAVREAKERIRRDNIIANESKIIDLLATGNGGQASGSKNGDNWLFDEVAGTLGPRSVAADLESLGGRSNKSGKSKNSMGNKSHRSHRSKHGHRRHKSRDFGGDVSVDSRTSRNSRNSYRSYQTTKSMVSQMSEQSRSVANDLLRLEAQLSMVGKRSGGGSGSSVTPSEHSKRRDDCGMTVTSRDFSLGRSSTGGVPRPKGSKHISASARRAAAVSLRSKVTVMAPPGKLGIILANRTDSRGTVVSGVRTSSVLAEQVSPGDRIIAIDDEDVSQMNVKEITTIMARKSEFERVLVLLTAPKHQYD